MNRRLKEVRKFLGLTQEEFAKQIGIERSTLSSNENGINPIQKTTIISICSVFNVNQKWFETGEGSMFNENKQFDDFLKIFKKLNSNLQEFLLDTAKNLLKLQEKL